MSDRVSTSPFRSAARRPNEARGTSRRRHEVAGWVVRSSGPRPRRSPRRWVVAALVTVGVLFAALVLLPELPVSGAPAGAPNLSGAVIVDDGVALAEVGYVGFGNVWEPAANGTQVYSQAFYVVFFDLRTAPTTVDVVVTQGGGYVENASIYLAAVSTAAITLTLPANPSWIGTQIAFDGVKGWTGSVATPVSLLPNYIIDVGGLDLFALTLVSLMLINVMGGVVAARAVIRRAIWAPRFSMLIWGHVVLALIAAAVFVDYQAIDSTFAGWSPVVYPFLTFPMAFLWALSLFNRGEVVQVQVGARTPTGGLGYYLAELRVGRLPPERGGALVWVGESWGDLWARFWGHFVRVEDTDAKARPWLAPVVHLLSPTASLRSRRKARKRAAAGFPNSADALTRFPVLNPDRRLPSYIALGRDEELPVVPRYRLAVHRTVTVERVRKDEQGKEVVERVSRRRLSLPHYVVDGPASALALEEEHYEPAAAVWAKFASIRDLGRAFSKVSHAFDVLNQAVENRVQDEVYSKLATRYALRDRTTSGRPPDEVARATAGTRALLGERKPPATADEA
jgi:hypothetical protein